MDPIKRSTRSIHRQNRANLIQDSGKNLNSNDSGKNLNSYGVRKKLRRLEKLKIIAGRPNPQSQNQTSPSPTIETSDDTVPLLSHFAMAVFDETIGKMMEMRELLRHLDPKVRKKWETLV